MELNLSSLQLSCLFQTSSPHLCVSGDSYTQDVYPDVGTGLTIRGVFSGMVLGQW